MKSLLTQTKQTNNLGPDGLSTDSTRLSKSQPTWKQKEHSQIPSTKQIPKPSKHTTKARKLQANISDEQTQNYSIRYLGIEYRHT